MDFGDILKILRKDKNLTQDELAQKIDSSRSNIANYENGKNMPSVEVLQKLSELFDVSTDYLLGKTNERNPSEYNTPEIRAIARDVAKLKPEKKELFKNLLKQMSDEADEAHKR